MADKLKKSPARHVLVAARLTRSNQVLQDGWPVAWRA
jgi:hypothetical protein